jgi:hypothetical protein
MPSSPSTTASNTARLHVTVTDLAAVQRVFTPPTGRSYVLTRVQADDAGDGRWRVALDVVADPDQVQLLEARLHRNPSVCGVGRS